MTPEEPGNVSPSRPPDSFWREVPCGHPQDPLAWPVDDGWACHCGRLLDGEPMLSGNPDDHPQLLAIIGCPKCGCHVGIPKGIRRADRFRVVTDGALLHAAADWIDEVGRLSVQLGLRRVDALAEHWDVGDALARDLRDLGDRLEAER